jgi:hypothetical protein
MGWRQADPKRDLILIWLVEATPSPPGPSTMPRFPSALANCEFQSLAYAALPQHPAFAPGHQVEDFAS